LIETFPCNSKDELTAREAYYQRQNINNPLYKNRNITGRTKKEWEKDNCDIIREKRKQYYDDDKEK